MKTSSLAPATLGKLKLQFPCAAPLLQSHDKQFKLSSIQHKRQAQDTDNLCCHLIAIICNSLTQIKLLYATWGQNWLVLPSFYSLMTTNFKCSATRGQLKSHDLCCPLLVITWKQDGSRKSSRSEDSNDSATWRPGPREWRPEGKYTITLLSLLMLDCYLGDQHCASVNLYTWVNRHFAYLCE